MTHRDWSDASRPRSPLTIESYVWLVAANDAAANQPTAQSVRMYLEAGYSSSPTNRMVFAPYVFAMLQHVIHDAARQNSRAELLAAAPNP
ncbi:unnamed protein product [Lasius platythorax]|uniref:Uncharacterized protein n=1 Tax=Lasius platythorax TaxID=488582 RepID=A0AAV2N370_9HYME